MSVKTYRNLFHQINTEIRIPELLALVDDYAEGLLTCKKGQDIVYHLVSAEFKKNVYIGKVSEFNFIYKMNNCSKVLWFIEKYSAKKLIGVRIRKIRAEEQLVFSVLDMEEVNDIARKAIANMLKKLKN